MVTSDCLSEMFDALGIQKGAADQVQDENENLIKDKLKP